MKVKVLVVDDEPSARQLCADVLSSMGYDAVCTESAAEALSVLEDGQIDIMVSDVHMPGGSGIGLLRDVKEQHPSVDVLIVTGFATIPEAVEAVKLGAYDYLAKPFSVERFRTLIERLVERQRLAAENRLLKEELKSQAGFGDFVGTSAPMQRIYETILKVSGKRHPVLILGESGTGKELVARAIHAFGPVRGRPFVAVDCGALTPGLIESEMFGHTRGAFTGATQSRTGLLAAAGAGTVMLDEIGELPLDLQAKLLRALQQREIRPVGSNDTVPLRARILAATNCNLEAAVEKGTFRQDLYFRLNVVSITVPPLRERKQDIPALVDCFVERHGGRAEGVEGFALDAMAQMVNYAWPGNVRELENCVQHALSLGSGPILQSGDLPATLFAAARNGRNASDSPSPQTLEDLERRAILNAIEIAGGDRLRAAKRLGIGKTTIYRKLKEYGIDPEESILPPRSPRSTID